MEKSIKSIQGKDGVFAVMETTRGNIVLELYYKDTPLTVVNFVGLAEGTLDAAKGKPFYDGLTFHRVISKGNGDDQDFMIQGGDPRGNGTGGRGPKDLDTPFAEAGETPFKPGAPRRRAPAPALDPRSVQEHRHATREAPEDQGPLRRAGDAVEELPQQRKGRLQDGQQAKARSLRLRAPDALQGAVRAADVGDPLEAVRLGQRGQGRRGHQPDARTPEPLQHPLDQDLQVILAQRSHLASRSAALLRERRAKGSGRSPTA